MFIFKKNLSLRQIETSLFFPMHALWANYSKQSRLNCCYLPITKSVIYWVLWLPCEFWKALRPCQTAKINILLILGNFNAWSKSWWCEDITSHEGPLIESRTMPYGLQQLISDPTHVLSNSSSCIDLIFMDQS